MDELITGLILAVGGAGLLAALTFRQMAETVSKLNRELQTMLGDHHAERAELKDEIDQLEADLDDCQEQINNLKKIKET